MTGTKSTELASDLPWARAPGEESGTQRGHGEEKECRRREEGFLETVSTRLVSGPRQLGVAS